MGLGLHGGPHAGKVRQGVLGHWPCKGARKGDGGWINGGFFVLSPQCIDYIDSDDTFWELKPLNSIAADKELMAFKHAGFWQPMDTLREKNLLEELWSSGKAPWKSW
jgi:glucose-1-phosphate cytidylyltransferase